MPISDSVFSRLSESAPKWGETAAPPAPDDDKPGSIPPLPGGEPMKKALDDSKVSSSRYLWESFTRGLAATPELANLATRTLLPFDAVKKAFPAGAAESATARALTPERANAITRRVAGGGLVDFPGAGPITEGEGSHEEVLKKDPGVLTKAVAPLVEGVGMAPLGMVPGAGPMKAMLIGAGASEGSAIGKDVLGATGEWAGGETGRKVGEGVGSVAGGAVGGYANVVRYNTLAKGTQMGGKSTLSALNAVPAAVKAARAAQAAGDERKFFPIFMDQFGDIQKGGLGFIQERTNEKVSNLIARDPRSEQAINDFRDAAKSVLNKGEEELFSTSQISDNPTLYKMETTRRIQGAEQASVAFERESKRRKALTGAYTRIVDNAIPADTQTMARAVNSLAAKSMDDILVLEEAKADIRGGVRNFSSEGRRGNGAAMREQYEAELAKSKTVNEQNYQRAYQLDTTGVDIGASKGPVKDVLRQFEAQIKEGTAPPSITNLKRAIEAGEESGLILPGGQKTGTRVPLKDVDQVIKDLGSDAHDAYSAYERSKNTADLSRAKNLERVQESLLGSVSTTNPEAAAAYHEARSRYAADHAPRFNSGVASAMEVERHAPGTRGRPRYPDETVMDQFLNKPELPTRMAEFDKLFGGFGGATKNDAAYKTLSNAIEDRFSKETLNTNFTPEKAEKFMRDYESALDRVPGTRNRLVSASENLDKIKSEQARIQTDFETLINGDITQEIGPAQAAQLFTQALSDPLKMEKLLASELGNTPDNAKRLLKEAMAYANPLKPDGSIDYTKLAKLMEAGQQRVDMPNTLEMLTNRALGNKEGAAHLERMKQISELMRRDAQLDPEHLRIADKAAWGDNPVKSQTGQTLASWLTGFRSMDAGFGKHYFPLISAGRFVNTRIQTAVEGSIQKALYDPETSKAVLEMVATPQNQPISSKVLDSIFGSSTELRRVVQKELLEQGLVRKITEQGALIGGTKAVTGQSIDDKERAKRRSERKRNLDFE